MKKKFKYIMNRTSEDWMFKKRRDARSWQPDANWLKTWQTGIMRSRSGEKFEHRMIPVGDLANEEGGNGRKVLSPTLNNNKSVRKLNKQQMDTFYDSQEEWFENKEYQINIMRNVFNKNLFKERDLRQKNYLEQVKKSSKMD